MRQNSRITGRGICAAVALVITVTVCGVPAVAPAAFADSAVASAATHSALASSPQGPETRQGPDSSASCVFYLSGIYPEGDSAVFTVWCNIPATAPTSPLWGYALAVGACVGGLVRYGVFIKYASFACGVLANPHLPFSQEQWCSGNDCPNAWGGGPWVNVYTGGPETGDTNQDFFLADDDNANDNATGYYQIIYAGSSSWAGECIGDAYNNSGYADTSLDPCGSASGGAGWGTIMTVGTSGCPSGEAWFHDNHWNGYLAPANDAGNGSHFYLNDQSKVCFNVEFEGS
jgi:hypothetical protein